MVVATDVVLLISPKLQANAAATGSGRLSGAWLAGGWPLGDVRHVNAQWYPHPWGEERTSKT